MSISAAKNLAQGPLEITRESTVIIVRDNSIRIREQLNEEELAKWADSKFITHLKMKASADTSGLSKKHDALFEAASKNRADTAKYTGRPETGVSIQVGIGQADETGAADDNDDDVIEVPDFVDDFEPLF